MMLQLFLLMEKIISIYFFYVSKDKAINISKNVDLIEKQWSIIKHKNPLLYIKDE